MKSLEPLRPGDFRDWRKPTVYTMSKTVPGQSLIPADLLKRHIAGTLPDIDLSQRYAYHVDENGERIGEPFPLEMHELYKLALEHRKQAEQRAVDKKKKDAEAFKESIIAEYVKSQRVELVPKPGQSAPDSSEPTNP